MVWGGGAVKLAALLDVWAVQCISAVAWSSPHLMVGFGWAPEEHRRGDLLNRVVELDASSLELTPH